MSTRDADMIRAISAIEDDEDGPDIPMPPASRPAQVYSVRIPVDRIEQLRSTATELGTTPSALIRTWVIERLDGPTVRASTPFRASRSARTHVDARALRKSVLRAV